MSQHLRGAVERLIFFLFAAAGLVGCAVYEPADRNYEQYPYGPPAYLGPPVTLHFGFGYYDYDHRDGRSRGHGENRAWEHGRW